MSTVSCPNCGNINSSSDKNCRNCSYLLAQQDGLTSLSTRQSAVPSASSLYPPPPPPSSQFPYPYQPDSSPNPPKKGRRSFVFAIILLLVGLVVGVGGDRIVNHFISLPQNDPNMINYVSDASTTPSTYVGIIRHAIITDAYNSQDGGTGASHYHCAARYMVAGNPNSQAEIFWDRDYPPIKTNSADVYNTCTRYKENSGDAEQGKPVTLIVTGVRDSSVSVFRNILFVLPEDQ